MDIIVGGGKYGCEAVEYLRKKGRSFVLVDIDPNCLAVTRFGLKSSAHIGKEGEHFLQGGIATVLELIDALKPEYIFPTAPTHIAAELAKIKFELAPWDEEINSVLVNLPPTVILRAGRGNLIVSTTEIKTV